MKTGEKKNGRAYSGDLLYKEKEYQKGKNKRSRNKRLRK